MNTVKALELAQMFRGWSLAIHYVLAVACLFYALSNERLIQSCQLGKFFVACGSSIAAMAIAATSHSVVLSVQRYFAHITQERWR